MVTGSGWSNIFSPGAGGKWVKIYQEDKAVFLKRNPHLRGESLKVLHYLETAVQWGNILPGTSVVAEALGLLQPNVSRAYAELLEAGIILRQGGLFYFNPFYCWKGNDKDGVVACQKLFAQTVDALTKGKTDQARFLQEAEAVRALQDGSVWEMVRKAQEARDKDKAERAIAETEGQVKQPYHIREAYRVIHDALGRG